jgi:hypothetical protein
MKAESIVYAIAGMCFGIILGWIIATQQPARTAPAAAETAAAPQSQPTQAAGGQQSKVLDEYDRLVDEFGLSVVTATGSITDQQRTFRKLVSEHLEIKNDSANITDDIA